MAGYYCKNCKTIHGELYKLYEQIPINYYYKCPTCGEQSVVSIDDELMYAISELNKKGYETTFCCAGHEYNGYNHTNMYIAFNCKLPNKPYGFKFKDSVLRYNYKKHEVLDIIRERHRIIERLNKWVDKLEIKTER